MMIDDHGGIVTMHIKIDNHFLVHENNQVRIIMIYSGHDSEKLDA